MAAPTPTKRRLATGALVCAVGVLAVVALDGSRPEVQMFTFVSLVLLGGVVLWSRRAAADNPPITQRFLIGAFGLHLVGSLLRFAVIQEIYNGISDSNIYFDYGKLVSPTFRALEVPAFPELGTDAMKWVAGLILAVSGDSLLASFAICATLSFFGGWFFYKAFRIGFPGGDAKLFAKLIFLLPSLWYWPTSLGKDAVVMFFLGIAVYGMALILRARSVHGVLVLVIGTGGVALIRPPLAAVPVIAGCIAAIASVVWPSAGRRERAARSQLVTLALVVPLLLGMVVLAVVASSVYVGDRSIQEAYVGQLETDFTTDTGDSSNYEGVSLFSPAGIPAAIVSANFRPFPWEAGGLFPALAALEGVVLAAIIIVRRRAIGRALFRWKDSPMTVFAASAWVGMSLILSSLTNFGLLARQRTQALPFLLLLIAAVADNSPGKIRRAPAARLAHPTPERANDRERV